MSGFNTNQLISKGEDIADEVLRRSKLFLPTIARLCLISTFLEDGIRMYFQWNEQRDYMDISWGCGRFLATIFVIFNMGGQLAGCFMVLFRFRVAIACILLFSIVMMQTIAYSILWDMQFLFRNLALVGGLLLLLAESRAEARSLFAGVPTLGDNKPKSYLQLTGRILLVFMFLSLIRLEFSFLQLLLATLLQVWLFITVKLKLKILGLTVILEILRQLHNIKLFISYHKKRCFFFNFDKIERRSVKGGVLFVVQHALRLVSLKDLKKAGRPRMEWKEVIRI
nr:EOG090X0AUC [Artemia franciscana]